MTRYHPRALRHREDWHPAAGLGALRLRSEILAHVRAFFAERGVLEVETPLLATTTATEPHLASIRAPSPDAARGALFLQTSPESFMKRLLAAGSGPIFQLCKAFRAGESGRHHNPEFTILEWYRPGFGAPALMEEVDSLVGSLPGAGQGMDPGARISYADAFRRHAGLDPFDASLSTLQERAGALGLPAGAAQSLDRDECLDWILSQVVQPALGPGPVFLFGFPASQSAMARLVVDDDGHTVAERFELFIGGVELANGYRELGNAGEQRARFLADIRRRREKGLPAVPLDEGLLAALAHGLPDCAGVAVGVDRLVMLAAGAESLDEVMAFPFGRV